LLNINITVANDFYVRLALPGEVRNHITGQLESIVARLAVADPVDCRYIFSDALEQPNLHSNLTDHINNMKKVELFKNYLHFGLI
jgi:hypothetical protein